MKNVICSINNCYIKAVDCSNGNTLFELNTDSDMCYEYECVNSLILHIQIKSNLINDNLSLGHSWAIDRIDGLVKSTGMTIGWVQQYCTIGRSRKHITFKKGNMKLLNDLSDKYDVNFAPIFIERYTNHSSWYTDKEICLRETIKVYYKRRQSVYNRQLDVFMSACYKLGLNIKKYNSRNMKDYSSFQILTEICKDLNYNILAII